MAKKSGVNSASFFCETEVKLLLKKEFFWFHENLFAKLGFFLRISDSQALIKLSRLR